MSRHSSLNIEAADYALVEAIRNWQNAPSPAREYQYGNAQGMARALAALHGATFTDEWVRGLDNYQNSITAPERGLLPR